MTKAEVARYMGYRISHAFDDHDQVERDIDEFKKINVIEFCDALQAIGLDPLAEIERVLREGDLDDRTKLRAYIDLLPYLYAKKKEVTGTVEHNHRHESLSETSSWIEGMLGDDEDSETTELSPH